jgi:4-hydroxybenzoate polyprenyltransferase
VHRPNHLTLAITAVFVLAGLVVGGIAMSQLVADPRSDVAWVSVLLAVGLVLWGIDFAALGAVDDPGDDDAPARVSTRTELLTSGIVAALGYVLLRTASDVPPLLCLLAVVVVVGLRMVERIVRRRRGRGRPTAS